MNAFDSKKELDNLMHLITTAKAEKPSEIINLYFKLEKSLIKIHKIGYEDGLGMKKLIDNII